MAAHAQSDFFRILIVDDADPPAIDDLRLRGHGADVRIAKDGQAALECARAWTPAIVLTELYLPDMTGFQLLAALRSNLPEKGALRVFAFTSHAGLPDRLRASEAGFDAFFHKPLNTDLLCIAIGLDVYASRRGPIEPAIGTLRR